MSLKIVDADIFDARLAACMSCPLQEGMRCSVTDSNILLKVKLENEICPENKWVFNDTIINSSGTTKKFLNLEPHKRLVTKKTSIEDIIHLAKTEPANGWPDDFEKFDNVQEAFRQLSKEKSKDCLFLEYPADRMSGRGIVICGGGPKYFPSVYVNIRMIRMLGCLLPIEVWYLGRAEMDFGMVRLLESLPLVKCIDETLCGHITPIRNDDSDKRNRGWQSKVYSIINSNFEEVLFIDADNTPLLDPTFLFTQKEYVNTGAILWPDFLCWKHDKKFWEIIGIPFRQEHQIESGQVLVNKRKCWKEINMAKYYCDYSDYYFKHFYGDKEAFHLGWRYFGSDYAQPPLPDWNGYIILQRKFDGQWLFSHRVSSKFNLNKQHQICRDIPYEKDTLELLDELSSKWKGNVWHNNTPSDEEKEVIQKTVGLYKYERVGLGIRDLELKKNDRIGEGSERLERLWHIFKNGSDTYMSILGDGGELTCLLKKNEDGDWIGRWENYEKCEVKLIPYGI